MSDKYHKVIGIDLGTTYSAVAVFNRYEEETEIIPNPQSVDGQKRPRLETTPSVVSREPQSGKAIVAIKPEGRGAEALQILRNRGGYDLRCAPQSPIDTEGTFSQP